MISSPNTFTASAESIVHGSFHHLESFESSGFVFSERESSLILGDHLRKLLEVENVRNPFNLWSDAMGKVAKKNMRRVRYT